MSAEETDNPTPREELEQQVIALIMGELDLEETAAIEEEIAKSEFLQEFHRRMQATFGFVQEAMDTAEVEKTPAPLRFSDERREALFEKLKVVELAKVDEYRSRWNRKWVMGVAVAACGVLLVGLLAGMFGGPSLRMFAKSQTKPTMAFLDTELGADEQRERFEPLSLEASRKAVEMSRKNAEKANSISDEFMVSGEQTVALHEQVVAPVRLNIADSGVGNASSDDKVKARDYGAIVLPGAPKGLEKQIERGRMLAKVDGSSVAVNSQQLSSYGVGGGSGGAGGKAKNFWFQTALQREERELQELSREQFNRSSTSGVQREGDFKTPVNQPVVTDDDALLSFGTMPPKSQVALGVNFSTPEPLPPPPVIAGGTRLRVEDREVAKAESITFAGKAVEWGREVGGEQSGQAAAAYAGSVSRRSVSADGESADLSQITFGDRWVKPADGLARGFKARLDDSTRREVGQGVVVGVPGSGVDPSPGSSQLVGRAISGFGAPRGGQVEGIVGGVRGVGAKADVSSSDSMGFALKGPAPAQDKYGKGHRSKRVGGSQPAARQLELQRLSELESKMRVGEVLARESAPLGEPSSGPAPASAKKLSEVRRQTARLESLKQLNDLQAKTGQVNKEMEMAYRLGDQRKVNTAIKEETEQLVSRLRREKAMLGLPVHAVAPSQPTSKSSSRSSVDLAKKENAEMLFFDTEPAPQPAGVAGQPFGRTDADWMDRNGVAATPSPVSEPESARKKKRALTVSGKASGLAAEQRVGQTVRFREGASDGGQQQGQVEFESRARSRGMSRGGSQASQDGGQAQGRNAGERNFRFSMTPPSGALFKSGGASGGQSQPQAAGENQHWAYRGDSDGDGLGRARQAQLVDELQDLFVRSEFDTKKSADSTSSAPALVDGFAAGGFSGAGFGGGQLGGGGQGGGRGGGMGGGVVADPQSQVEMSDFIKVPNFVVGSGVEVSGGVEAAGERRSMEAHLNRTDAEWALKQGMNEALKGEGGESVTMESVNGAVPNRRYFRSLGMRADQSGLDVGGFDAPGAPIDAPPLPTVTTATAANANPTAPAKGQDGKPGMAAMALFGNQGGVTVVDAKGKPIADDFAVKIAPEAEVTAVTSLAAVAPPATPAEVPPTTYEFQLEDEAETKGERVSGRQNFMKIRAVRPARPAADKRRGNVMVDFDAAEGEVLYIGGEFTDLKGINKEIAKLNKSGQIEQRVIDPNSYDLAKTVGLKSEKESSRKRFKQQAEKGGVNVAGIANLSGRLVESEEETVPMTPVPSAARQTSKVKPKKPKTLKPKPEILTTDNEFSTFSLNVSDVAFKLAVASLDQGKLPEPDTVRSEEFVNALDYHDPAPQGNERLAFAWERARNPFTHNRDMLRFSVQTAARGRETGQPLNLVVLLDSSGSMERADRVKIVREMLAVLAGQLKKSDKISVIAFARTPWLLVDGMAGGKPGDLLNRILNVTPQGGTNLEIGLDTAYSIAQRHYLAKGNNRVIVLTDGAANLGNIDPEQLNAKVESFRKKNIALDCFGVGWEGYNDTLLESLSRNGDGRYGFINNPQDATHGFADLLAGALQVAAANVKVQIEFNPERVTSYRQIGYDKHQLTKEQFRDNTVDAAEIGAVESGTAMYSVQVNREGKGGLGVVRVRYKIPTTGRYVEESWDLEYDVASQPLEAAKPAMRLASVAVSFAEWLAANPHAGNVNLGDLQSYLTGLPEEFFSDERPKQLARMIQQARQISGE